MMGLQCVCVQQSREIRITREREEKRRGGFVNKKARENDVACKGLHPLQEISCRRARGEYVCEDKRENLHLERER